MGGATGTGITLYSRWRCGPDEGWKKTEMHGVSWHGGPGATVSGAGLTAGGFWVVRIPYMAMAPGYLSPDEWDCGDGVGFFERHWTLRPGDVLAKGHGLPEAEGSILEATSRLGECFVVSGVRDNRRGAQAGWHLRAEGGG